MAIMPQTPRQQKLFLMALIAVAGAGAYWNLVWTPKDTELSALEVRLDTLDSLNKAAKADVAKGNSAKMKAEAVAYGRELGVLRHLVPTTNEVPPLLESISNSARRAGLEVSEFSPDGVVNGDQFDTYKYKIGVVGPYHQVAAFLANIASLPRIVAPINFTAKPSQKTNSEAARPKPDEQLLDAKFGVQTYVAHIALKPAGPTKPSSP